MLDLAADDRTARLTDTLPPPLILGATGRIGRAFRRIHQLGLWPDLREPLWLHRPGHDIAGNALCWDMSGPPPADYRLHMTHGIIVLAGATAGDAGALESNTAAAQAALRLQTAGVAGPVLLMSSAAVYGRLAAPLSEDRAAPAAPYGMAKLAMETAMAGLPGVTCLRLANVAGADALFGAMARGPVSLDRFAGGHGPRRSYIGPVTLAAALLALRGMALPPVLNLAQPCAVAMEAVLRAAGADWHWTPAPESALPEVMLDTARLQAILPLPMARPAQLVAEAETAGWTRP